MDEPDLPSADLPSAEELGVSEIEYERIVRGLRDRGLGGERVAFAAEMTRVSVPETPAGLFDAPAADAPRRRRRSIGWPAAVAGALALGVVGWRGISHHADPAYAFLNTADGRPVTYSSCKPVQVAVYPANGPADAIKVIQDAIDTMRSATGLNIVLVGAFGGHAPNWNFGSAPIRPDDPVAISWQDGRAIAELTDDIAGLGGSFIISGRNGTQHLASGTIALSRDEYARLAAKGDHAEEVAIVLHEFGHVFGLAHVDSSGELMNKHNLGRTTLGPGDLEGLRLAGHGPCV